jgi:hypothetical protein
VSEEAVLQRLEALESESAIRRIVARYFAICDDLGPNTPLDELGELFSEDAIWEGKGRYAKAFGRFEGRDAIIAMLRSYALPEPHFEMTAHFFSSECLTASGAIGAGQWMMLQTTDYADGTADFRSARLTINFARSISGPRTFFHARSIRGTTRKTSPCPTRHQVELNDEHSRLCQPGKARPGPHRALYRPGYLR